MNVVHRFDVELVVSGGASLAAGTLLDKLSVALCLEALPGDLLLHVGALLPGGGSALADRDVGTVLIVHLLGHHSRHLLTHLVRDLVTDLTGSDDIGAHLQ